MKTFDPKKPFKQRDGFSARLICDNISNDIYPLCIAYDCGGYEEVALFGKDGSFINGENNPEDLINIEEPEGVELLDNQIVDYELKQLFSEMDNGLKFVNVHNIFEMLIKKIDEHSVKIAELEKK